MYQEHFGLREPPFSITPDPRFLYMSEQHREGLAHLLYGLQSDGGFVLLTGEVGSGKTTLCRYLLDQVPENCIVAFVINPRVTVLELLSTICDEFHITYPERNQSVKVFVDRINAFLLDSHAKGRKAVLIIDEAQNLSKPVLEQIRLLTNLETSQRKLLQIVLLGQPELRDRLARPELRQLSQRIIARYHLGALDKADVKRYVAHRLTVAGTRNELFSPGALDVIFDRSRGIPRLVNVICDRALLGTYSQGKPRVDRWTVLRAAREALGEPRRARRSRKHDWFPVLSAFGTVAAVCAGLYFFGLLPASLVPPAPQTPAQQQSEAQVSRRKPIPQLNDSPTASEIPPEAKREGDPTPAPVPALASSDADRQSREDPPPAPPTPQTTTTPEASRQEAPPSPVAEEVTPREVPKDPPAAVAESSAPLSVEKLAEQVRSSGQEDAVGALFRKWGLAYQTGGSDDACRQARGHGLRCFDGRGGLDELRGWDRPALVKLKDNRGEEFQAALMSLEERSATFSVGGQNLDIGAEEFRERFSGEFFVLWPVPAGYGGEMRRGQQGPKVAWLELQLARARGETVQPIPSARFNDTVVRQVKEFQEANGLKPDGIIGSETLNRLMFYVDTNAPRLTPTPKDR